jgi:flagellar protein FlaI
MGLLDKAQQKKNIVKENNDDYISNNNIKKDESKGLLEKSQSKRTNVEETKSEKEVIIKNHQTKTEGLLLKSQQIKEHSKELKDNKTIKSESVSETKGLLEKASKKINTEDKNKEKIKTDKDQNQKFQNIEQKKGFGWKHLGSKRIIYDENVNEYKYEVIEPELTESEIKVKKELSHLFKMLADIETFDMTFEEKEKFLVETIEQIIQDNDVKFNKLDKKDIFYDLLTDYIENDRIVLSLKDDNNIENNIEKLLLETNSELYASSKDKIYYHLFRDFLGYGRLDIVMHDDGIEDISCDGPETPIFIHHRKYEAIETNIYFEGEEELNSFIVRLCQISGKQISIYSPIVDGKLPDGSRLQATLARTVTKGSTFTIRKFKENPLTPLDLIEFKSLSAEMAAYFWIAIESGASILFCGGTASGKTTALNALSLFIPSSHKIVSIEDTREVSLPHKNWIAGTTRKGFSSSEENKTGKDIDMFDLIRAALRQRPRVIIVGEVRGKEAYSLFQAMATGHTSYATVHASTIHTLIQRLENPPISLPRALLTSLDVIVFQNAVEIGKKMVRRMTSVTEIIKLDSDTNQLIFMAPFTWISKTDDRFESSRNSKIYNRMKQQNDWSDDELDEEISNRITVLEWMRSKNIHSYQEFGKIIAEYQKYPDRVLKRAKMELKK